MSNPPSPVRIRTTGARWSPGGGIPVWCHLLGVLLLGGCGSSTEPVRDPVSITVTPGSLVFDALQDTQTLEARVLAEDGSLLTEVPVIWTSLNPAVVEVSAGGVVRSLGNGETSVRATAGNATRTIAVSVTQIPANLEILQGNEQDAPPGTVLPLPLRVRIADRLGNPIRRVILFSVAEGGGSVFPGSVTSAADGTAQAVWTLGPSTGPQSVLVNVPGASQLSVRFRTAGTPPPPPPGGFSIEFDFAPSVSPAVRQAFETAAERWREIIAEKLPTVFLTVPPGSCGPNPQLLTRSFDDLFVFVTVEPFAPEQAGILASAAPCFLREGSRLPIVSRIRLNESQVPGLLTGGRLYNVVLHELGHALGIGTIWNQLGLLRNPSLPNQPGADTHFAGPRAIAAYDAVGGTGFTGGSKVPVENTQGGQGTRDSHWRYFALGNELMVGFIFTGATPISRITVASLADLGYEVNENAADPYSLPAGGALAPPAEEALPLHEDVIPGPMYLVNPRGQVVDTIPAPPGRD